MSKELGADLFIGPLPMEVYDCITAEFKLSKDEEIVEFAARALYGQTMAQKFAEKTKAESSIDGLTGVYNRDTVYFMLREQICGLEMSRRGSDLHKGLVVTVFDAEDFKQINDRSWDLGNEALKIVGMGLTKISRVSKGDVPARIGGDEFLLITSFNHTETTPSALLASLEDRIKYDLPALFPNMPKLRWHHAFYQPGDSEETLIGRAYPKGDNKPLMRSHSQSDLDYKVARQTAIESASLPSTRTLLKGA